MFGIGFGEMVIIALVLLLAVGPKELPSLLKSVGKGMKELRKATDDLRRSTGIEQLMQDEELRNPVADIKKMLQDPAPARAAHKLTPADLEREAPGEGVDLAYARQRADLDSRMAQPSALAQSLPPPKAAPISEGG